MKRRHGFVLPPSMQQVIAWVAILLQVLLNEISYIPSLRHQVRLPYFILYHLSLLVFIVFGVLTTLKDPTDPLSTIGLNIQNNKQTSICAVCKCSVKFNSKHCGVCNRCVSGFDHHCVWINNCIGEKNYRIFILTISGFMINSLLVLGFTTYSIVKYSLDDKLTIFLIHEKVDEHQGDGAWLSQVSIIFTYGVITSIFSVTLVTFHIWLKYKKLTTFQFILNKRFLSLSRVSPPTETYVKDREVSRTTIDAKDF